MSTHEYCAPRTSIVHQSKYMRKGRSRLLILKIPWCWLICLFVWKTDAELWIASGESSSGSTSRSPSFFCAAEIVVDNENQSNTLHAATEDLLLSATTVSPPPAKNQLIKETLTLNQLLYRAGKRGLGGGVPGAIAGAIQVLSLMWLRTIINYQCRYGTTFLQALRPKKSAHNKSCPLAV